MVEHILGGATGESVVAAGEVAEFQFLPSRSCALLGVRFSADVLHRFNVVECRVARQGVTDMRPPFIGREMRAFDEVVRAIRLLKTSRQSVDLTGKLSTELAKGDMVTVRVRNVSKGRYPFLATMLVGVLP